MEDIDRELAEPAEFDLTATIRKLLAENRLTAEDALTAILEGLMDQHKAARDAHRGGPEPVTYLQGLEVVLSQEHNKNLGIYERQAVDEEPDNIMYMSGLMFGQLAAAQCVVCDILCRCMKVLGSAPLRDAA